MNQERFRANLNRRLGARRAGFTLVELLMVIVVIGILSSLLVVASMSVLGTSREAATKSTLSKINTMLKERMAAFETHMSNYINGGVHLTLGAPDERSGKILLRKREFKKYFPQTWDEAKEIAATAGVSIPTSPSSSETEKASESAEVLLMFLTKTTVTGQGEIGQDAFVGSELADKDGDQKMEIVDAWGTPLRFYRWPCRLIKPEDHMDGYPTDDELKAARTQIPALTTDRTDKAINSDPDDPLNLMQNISTFANDYHMLKAYHTPLVVSGGVDSLFGLENPIDSNVDNRQAKPIAGNTSELYDNLTNLNALAGGSQ